MPVEKSRRVGNCARGSALSPDYPGAVVVHSGGRATYSDGFVRFILELYDEWEGSPESFCRQVEVPYSTFRVWCNKDKGQAYGDHQDRPISYMPIRQVQIFDALSMISQHGKGVSGTFSNTKHSV